MKKCLPLILSLIVFNSFAQETSTEKLNQNENTSKSDITSEREGKKVNLILGIGGNYSETTTGVGASYFLNRDQTIGLNYKSYDERDEEDANLIGSRAEILKVVEAEFKHFTGNSFYIAPSIYYRKFEDRVLNESSDLFSSNKSYLLEDVGVGFRIGNQWHKSNFTIGCDWIGISRNVKVLEQSGSRDFLSFRPLTSVSVLNFYVGASF